MLSQLEQIKSATAYVNAGAQRGTGYLVSPDTAVTCAHVLGGKGEGDSVGLTFLNRVREATVVSLNAEEDYAVLRLKSALEDVSPLTLASDTCARGDKWEAYGYPAITGEVGHWLEGTVQDPNGKDPSGNDSVVLYSREIAAADGAPPQGFSGTPVLIGGRVVGHLKRIIPNQSYGTTAVRAMMGTLYACPLNALYKSLPSEREDGPEDVPQPPAAGYDRRWYVKRKFEEDLAMGYLEFPGTPVILWGPFRSGKTTMLQHLLYKVRQAATVPLTVVVINLGHFERDMTESLDAMLKELAGELAQQFGGQQLVEQAWGRPSTPNKKCTWLMRELILPRVEGQLILGIDNADSIWQRPYKDDFFGLLRTWADPPAQLSYAEKSLWAKLRLILGISSSPSLLIEDPMISPFNLSDPIELDDLEERQILRLAKRYGLHWTEDDLALVRREVGGQPYLLRVLMYRTRLTGMPLNLLLRPQNLRRVFSSYFDRHLRWLARNENLTRELNHFSDGNSKLPLDLQQCRRLIRAGLLTEDEDQVGQYRLRYGLYRYLFG